MFAISRFRAQPGFDAVAQPAIEFWRNRPGCLAIHLVQNIDEPDLYAVISQWESVGAYRASFSGYDAKMILTPLFNLALDEPSAYLPPTEVGSNIPRSV